jgi:drug/metabolite transporter (DMT)-like permease
VAPFVFLQPLAGVIAGNLVFGEVLSPAAVAGAVLIACGVLLVIRPDRRGVLPST